MTDHAIIVMGLPASGKTTYLAALWHVVTADDLPTKLKLATLGRGNMKYLNAIAARWRDAQKQERTLLQGPQIVEINLKRDDNTATRVTFPDVPGEEYRRMWEERDVDPELGETLWSGDILLFVHADEIRAPSWVVNEVALYQRLGLDVPENEIVEWHPRISPTQVQLVELLQHLRRSPLDTGPRNLALVLSAWDKATGEGIDPDTYLAQKLPLLNQYLRSGADEWEYRIFGISAQGGEYDSTEEGAEAVASAEELRTLDKASSRITVVQGDRQSQDLTEPLNWLMEQR